MDQESVYVSFDPGETTGWATFNAEGELIAMGEFKQKDHTKELTRLIHSKIKACIVELYANFGWKEQKKWSQNRTSQNIGAIEMMCELRQVPYHKQPANIKKIGYKWAGIPVPTSHALTHQTDAYVHGVYWLQKNGIRKVRTPDD